jgi:glutamyl-tRNA synthetase
MEDLDRVTSSRANEALQLAELARLGLDHDGEVVRQSERFDLYRDALAELAGRGLTYPCWCTRREIAEAAAAPHGAVARYPGTCRDLSAVAAADRAESGRPAAVRLRAEGATEIEFDDLLAGPQCGHPDDIVLQRNDGVPAYNLAVVVDDAEQGVTQVVRGDDLLPATAGQIHLARLLGLTPPAHAHVPLVLGPDGTRLAKRHGAITVEETGASGDEILTLLAESLGLASPGERPKLPDLVRHFDPRSVPRVSWTFEPGTIPPGA